MTDKWKILEAALVNTLVGANANLKAFLKANIDAVQQVIRGLGPDDTDPNAGAGARIVFNMSCKHVPNFCDIGYKNAYDLNKASLTRVEVDDAIESAAQLRGWSVKKELIYFGAVETSGTGVRFYGDMCLVLRECPNWFTDESESQNHSATPPLRTLILDRNSYDVVREPVSSHVRAQMAGGMLKTEAQAQELGNWMGEWSRDLISAISIRVMNQLPVVARRWTTGQISQAVLDDEDYCEVLYPNSFCASELLEVRTNSSDAATEGDIADRERTGEAPGLHELEWRQQRRDARRALARVRVPIRIVGTLGRIKGS